MGIDAVNRKIREYYGQEALVFGEGKRHARLMLIGEAPGRDEIAEGKPFCGKAGGNLNEFLKEAAIRREDVYLTNVCKFRPYRISEKGTVANRTPSREEINGAAPFLYEEILAVQPRLIVTLGNTPLRACCSDFKKNVGDAHGKLMEVSVGGRLFSLFVLYHPASVIYNPALDEVYREDLYALKECVQRIHNG